MTLSLSIPSPPHPPQCPTLSPPSFPPSSGKNKTTTAAAAAASLSLRNRLITHQLNNGCLHQAICLLDSTTTTHPDDLITLSLLLNACTRSRASSLGRRLHSYLSRSGLEPDSVILNSLIDFYSKCNDPEMAVQVFQSMGDKKDLVSWGAIMSCFVNNGMEFDAIRAFVCMLEDGFLPNDYCYSAVTRACSVPGYSSFGNGVLGAIVKRGLIDSNVCVGCALIDMFVKGGSDLDAAYKVFDKMSQRNVVAWTLMITRCVQLGYEEDAAGLFVDMLLEGVVPDRFAISAVLPACVDSGWLSFGKQLHSWAVRSGLALDVCVGCCLLNMYAKCSFGGCLDDSRKVFDRMQGHSIMSWTATITAHVHNDENEEALRLFLGMIRGPVQPNHLTLSSVLKACANISSVELGRQIYSCAVKLGLQSDNCLGNSLISMYERFGNMDDAQKAFSSLFKMNCLSYDDVVDVHGKSFSGEAFEVFDETGDRKAGATAFALANLLSGAASIGADSEGEQIHAWVLVSGFYKNKCISNSLISMYSRCGDVEAAYRVFKKMEDRDVISWTSMITGFAKHGFAVRALDTFHRMLDAKVKPNGITYVAVLSACSHVGLINEGWQHFSSMYEDYGIVPKMEHYACMVDLLSRSGSLLQALQFINSMPVLANALVWRTFLGACRVHGDIELGRQAARMIFEHEPNDTSAYVLLANLYASKGKWEEVANIRKEMKIKNLIKEAGCSWIEIKNVVYKFHVGDTSHPQAQEIYDKLDVLVSKAKKLGYVPNAGFVLHDLEEEQKEKYLLHHSEKIAAAFGLIKTSNPKQIRIFKNLRVCGDCHSALKYISMAEGREIVLRDSNRFHHFNDGMCSCNDYW